MAFCFPKGRLVQAVERKKQRPESAYLTKLYCNLFNFVCVCVCFVRSLSRCSASEEKLLSSFFRLQFTSDHSKASINQQPYFHVIFSYL